MDVTSSGMNTASESKNVAANAGIDVARPANKQHPPLKRVKSHLFAQKYTSQTLLWASMFVAFLYVWLFGWLYFGAVWGTTGQAKTGQLPVAVMLCDQGLSAAQRQQAVASLGILGMGIAAATPSLGQALVDRSIFNTSSTSSLPLKWTAVQCSCAADADASCILQLEQMLKDGDYWAALFFPHGFSVGAVAWAAGNATAAPAVTYMYPQGRAYSAYAAVTKIVETVWQGISKSVANQAAGAITMSPGIATKVNPRFLVEPASLHQVNISPVQNSGQSIITYLLLVLVWLGATFSVSARFPVQLSAESDAVKKLADRGHTSVRQAHGILLAIVNWLLSYIFELIVVVLVMCIMLAYSTASVDAQKAQWLGHGLGYAIAFVWWSSFSFVHINHIYLDLMGDRFTAMSSVTMILMLTSCGGIWPVELQLRFFKVGVAFPFYYVRQGLSTIFFGVLENKMALNWGVLTAWNFGTGVVSLWLSIRKFKARAKAQLKGYIENVISLHVHAGNSVGSELAGSSSTCDIAQNGDAVAGRAEEHDEDLTGLHVLGRVGLVVA